MAHCYRCGATNCKLFVDGNQYICETCKRKDEEIDRKIESAKRSIMTFLLKIFFVFILPIVIGLGLTSSIKGIDHIALKIGCAVLAAALWVGLLILGKKSPNAVGKAFRQFARRICFGAALGFVIGATESARGKEQADPTFGEKATETTESGSADPAKLL